MSGEEYDLVELREVAERRERERRRVHEGQLARRDGPRSASFLQTETGDSRNEVIRSRPLSRPPTMRAVPLGAGQDTLEIDEEGVRSLGRDLSREELGPDGFGDFGFGPLQTTKDDESEARKERLVSYARGKERDGRKRRSREEEEWLNERTLKSLEVLNLNRVRAEGSGSSGCTSRSAKRGEEGQQNGKKRKGRRE